MKYSFNNVNGKRVTGKIKNTQTIRNERYEQTPEENRKILFLKKMKEFMGNDGDYKDYVDKISSHERFNKMNLTYLTASISMLTKNEEPFRLDNNDPNPDFFETDHWYNNVLKFLPKSNDKDLVEIEKRNRSQIISYYTYCENLMLNSNYNINNDYSNFGKELSKEEEEAQEYDERNEFLDTDEPELEIIPEFVNLNNRQNKIILEEF